MGENKTSLNEMIDSVLQASKAKHPRKDNAATIQYGTAGFRTRYVKKSFKLVLKSLMIKPQPTFSIFIVWINNVTSI